MQELHKVLNMSQYGWRCLDRMCICLNMSEFTITDRVLNMSGFWMSLIKYIAQGHSQVNEYLIERWTRKKPCQRSKNERFEKLIILTFFTKHFILNLWEVFQGSEFSWIVNIQSSEFPRLHRVYLFL